MGAEHCKTASPDDAAAVAHLAREACALAAVDHPDVVELVDWDPGTATLRTALAGRHTLADLDPTT